MGASISTPRRPWSAHLLSALLLAAVALTWFFFAPPVLGGSTLYSHTFGVSMEPRFTTGDVAVLRPTASYRVGDIALYRSVALNEPVLHRIVSIRGGRYFFKGDNNPSLDPGFATRAELVGKLWFRIPGPARDLAWARGMASGELLIGPAIAFIGLLFALLIREQRYVRGTVRRQRVS